MKLFGSLVLSCVVALGLSACGGGGGDGGGGAPATPEGRYLNATGDSELFVLDHGELYLQHMYRQDGSYIGGNAGSMLVGSLGVAGNTLSGTATRFAYAGDLYTSTVQITGSYSPGPFSTASSIDLTYTLGTSQQAFSGVSQPGFVTPAKLSDAAGSYNWPNGQAAGTIDAAGNIVLDQPAVNPCKITGTIEPHGNDRLYDAQLTFLASSQCTQQTLTGVAVPEGTNGLLFLMKGGYFLLLTKSS